MSGTDGRRICQKLRRQSETKKVPVVMISADPATKKGSYESGANDFLAKPFDTDTLIATIKRYAQ